MADKYAAFTTLSFRRSSACTGTFIKLLRGEPRLFSTEYIFKKTRFLLAISLKIIQQKTLLRRNDSGGGFEITMVINLLQFPQQQPAKLLPPHQA